MKLPLILLCLFCVSLSANVVINELCYDPAGEDSGYEWIELYNNGDTSENLGGAKILCAGSSWREVMTLPAFILRPGRYLLIGEASVANAMITSTLNFQNGGAETDGVRYLSPGGNYTDTVLYDSPNNNGLSGDDGVPISFAPDVPSGYSLARMMNGFDSNDCALDFYAEANPSPGLPNPIRCDYGISSAFLEQLGSQWVLRASVRNYSLFASDQIAQYNIKIDGEIALFEDLSPIAAGDSVTISSQLPIWDQLNHSLELSIELAADPDSVNNTFQLILTQVELLAPKLNELMYNPLVGYQEWIEIQVEETPPSRSKYKLRDFSGSECSFSLPANGGYFVLCQNADQLLLQYPSCPPSTIIELTSWITLNNEGDSIALLDNQGTVLDSMSYQGSNSNKGVSLERYQTASQTYSWRYSLGGASPGKPNSLPPGEIPAISGRVAVERDIFYPKRGETLRLIYNLKYPGNLANISIYDLSGRKQRTLANRLSIPATGILLWDGTNDTGKLLPRGPYILYWESQSTSGGKILRKQLDLVLAY